MSERRILASKPEEEELQLKGQELQALQEELIDRELQLAGAKGRLAAFERLYLRLVGAVYSELDDVEAQIAELLAWREPGNAKVRWAAEEARVRAEESRSGIAGLPAEAPSASPSTSLKSLYREVARRVHPDLALNDADRERRHGLMAQANQAFGDHDEQKLRAILEQYEMSPETVFGVGTAFDLVRTIRKIAQVKRRLAEIEAAMSRVMESDIFELKARVDEGTKAGRDVLREMAAAAMSRLDERRAELKRRREQETR